MMNFIRLWRQRRLRYNSGMSFRAVNTIFVATLITG
jgi:hypothetical protein